ncbi:LysR substrate-binding domain-containing protein [Uliginosibacterium sp. 31-12]|uniref:LysR substrate-binding domain-containing protein n=1 Tax=Uliginosibacterium sp. 31-12 TaxID=3062781 RepID=UPI0026E2B926|nr:LysR substrate-binding domain-containing protein [Uliginosibacterium sp. 31-12]MDO6387856.1 LysR substrate-binding domain-containing protein [Uliginosibacterium sp. 31-12]
MRITLRQLDVFCAIARHGQVTRAAQAVAMTQAAASMALADLERQLGCTLFDRVGRQLVLNASGRLLAGRAREVLDRVAEIEYLAQEREPVFDLHVGASVTIGNQLLPGLVAQMRKRWPKAHVQISRLSSRDLIAHLKAHQIDLGFLEGSFSDDAIQRYPWRQDRLCVFAAPDHPLAGRALSAEDFHGVPWVVREQGSGTRDVMTQACEEAGFTALIDLELEQPEAIRQCVKAGLGVGCLSELELADAFQAGSLKRLDTPFLDMPSRLDIVTLRDRYLSAGPRALLELCGIHPEA